jgi:hypothetical protein
VVSLIEESRIFMLGFRPHPVSIYFLEITEENTCRQPEGRPLSWIFSRLDGENSPRKQVTDDANSSEVMCY